MHVTYDKKTICKFSYLKTKDTQALGHSLHKKEAGFLLVKIPDRCKRQKCI